MPLTINPAAAGFSLEIEMAKKTYQVNWSLEHDGKTYASGDAFTIEEKDAAPLLACGVIALPIKAKDPEGTGE